MSSWACTACGAEARKWAGQCPHCSEWNTLEESAKSSRFEAKKRARSPELLAHVRSVEEPRMQTGMEAFDRLLGGGLVRGSLMLLGGEPGIGKSTLLLKLASSLSLSGKKVLYVCAEESTTQVAMRARRLGASVDGLYVFNETDFSAIRTQTLELQPDLVIIDSIQVIYKEGLSGSPGSISQIRELATEFMHLAKGEEISHVLVGHVTKGGEIAGPKVLEHLVDTVVYFEAETKNQYRLLRVIKNRFGPSDELAIFRMEESGLIPIDNPSQLFVGEPQTGDLSGSVVSAALDGARPFLVEVQALSSKTVFASPMRKASGFDQNRLLLLLAVMEKRAGMRLYQSDIFLSLAGGLRLAEPALDLAAALAVASSFMNRSFRPGCGAFGEIGLNGQLRAVSRPELRIKEMESLGLKECILPACMQKSLDKMATILKLTYVHTISEALQVL